MMVMMNGMNVTGAGKSGRRCKCVIWIGRGGRGGGGGFGILKGE